MLSQHMGIIVVDGSISEDPKAVLACLQFWVRVRIKVNDMSSYLRLPRGADTYIVPPPGIRRSIRKYISYLLDQKINT